MTEKRSRRLGAWIIAFLMLAAAGGCWFYYQRLSGDGEAEAYTGSPVTRGDLTISVLATGTIQPRNRLEIKPPIPGRAESVLVLEGATVKKGQILAWMSSTERAALLDAARSKGPEEVRRWEEFYRPTSIIAPINGTIILRNIEPGQTFTSSDQIFAMSDRLTVKAVVDETDLGQVRLDQKAEITVDAYPETVIQAKVAQIAFEAKTVNNVTTYEIDVEPLQYPEFMRAGMTVNVKFITAENPGVLLVGNEALRQEGQGAFVLVPATETGKPPVRREIKTGATDGQQTVIREGLQEGETVLVSQLPQERPKTGGSPFSPMGGGRRGGTGNNGGRR